MYSVGSETMTKYSPLGDFLRKQRRRAVSMTFAEIERVIGAKLPRSHRYRAWWSNNAFNSVMTKVWLEAGYRTEQVDMEGRRLVFRRLEAGQDPDGATERRSPRLRRRSSASARHPLFGALKGSVRIVPGTDLTQPADPDWGKNA